jgi:alpha-galactosidase
MKSTFCNRCTSRSRDVPLVFMICSISTLLMIGCNKSAPPSTVQKPVSAVLVSSPPGGPLVVKSPSAQFAIYSSGYIQASLLKEGKWLSMDEPQTEGSTTSDVLLSAGKELSQPPLDLSNAALLEAQGKWGTLGKRVELVGRSSAQDPVPLEKSLVVEVYDDFPTLALITCSYKNIGNRVIRLDQVSAARRRLNSNLTAAQAQPFEMWSFHGSSVKWGKDDVVQLRKDFSQSNPFGAQTADGHGGGIPVVAFWNGSVGEAIGHLDPRPLDLSIPVKVEKDGRVSASVNLEPNLPLKPGESFATPQDFIAIYSGDFYEPLHLYSTALERTEWKIPKPTNEDYSVSWCGWGFEFNVTPAQMLGMIPKLKEMNIKWATLDDRWFDNYGDWDPRPDTFPGDSIKKMVDDYHKQGIYAQIWWLPIGAEDGQAKYSSHKYKLSRVVREHPDWLILGKDGKHPRMIRDLAALCPALPEVQQYYKQLTEKFIRDWGFDGHKLDNVYSVPACYNPKHQHKSPQESVYAMGDVYRVIFETTRQLKPESVTQSCPCGTPPSQAWLPFMDQAVTADPVGGVQVRRRIKMYKALMGPEAAVYGDHVELSEMVMEKGNWKEIGQDFASTLGTGGVVGTKFTWPDYGPKFKAVYLNPEKEAIWKKWIGLYNSKMLSRGTFQNLYMIGYDVPEGYAIEKDGKMYYAFFAAQQKGQWKGDLELRGLAPGKYRVRDYVTDKDLGTVDAQNPGIAAEFTGHLLLEVSKL